MRRWWLNHRWDLHRLLIDVGVLHVVEGDYYKHARFTMAAAQRAHDRHQARLRAERVAREAEQMASDRRWVNEMRAKGVLP